MPESQSFEAAAKDRILQMIDPMVEATAQQMGMGSDTQHYSEADQLKMWTFSPIADPNERVQQMLQMHIQGASLEEITDAIYPERRKLIKTGRPKIQDQIAYAKQMDRTMARQARDQGIHGPYDDTWAKITAPNAPQDTSSASTGLTDPATAAVSSAPAGTAIPAGAPPPPPIIDAQPTQATSAPGWAQGTGSLF